MCVCPCRQFFFIFFIFFKKNIISSTGLFVKRRSIQNRFRESCCSRSEDSDGYCPPSLKIVTKVNSLLLGGSDGRQQTSSSSQCVDHSLSWIDRWARFDGNMDL